MSHLSPQEQIEAAIRVDVQGELIETVVQHPHSRITVSNARENVRVALYFLMPECISSTETLTKKEKAHLGHLQRLEERERVIKQIIEDPVVSLALQPLPHVRHLLEVYAHYATVKPLFDQYNIPIVGDKRIYDINRSIYQFIFLDTEGEGVLSLSTRVLFAKWIKEGVNWFGEDANLAVIRAAASLSEGEFSRESSSYLFQMRYFWEELIKAENSRHRAVKTSLAVIGNEVDGVLSHLSEYAQYGEVPDSLKDFAHSVVEHKYRKEMITDMFVGLKYDTETKTRIVTAGKSFLEAVLLSRANGNARNWLKSLDNRRRRYLLKNLREVIRVTRQKNQT